MRLGSHETCSVREIVKIYLFGNAQPERLLVAVCTPLLAVLTAYLFLCPIIGYHDAYDRLLEFRKDLIEITAILWTKISVL